jgi:3',5'-cyclic AMP phosphodiesterase CpdA
LTPSTTYQYRISTGGVVLHQAALSTASDASGFFNFVMIGDSGIGSVAQAGVAAQMLALDPDFMLHLGDVIYPSGQASGYNPYFFQPYRDLIDHTSVFPSLGNHDYITSKGQPYLDVFYLPSNNPAGTERYYSFDWGNAHFVALDSNRDYQPGSAMLQWLESDLAASAAKWKFVFFHHALHTSGPHRNDSTLPALRSALAPIFEQYDVDIVFNGHDHMYERSKPVNGVVYIVSGGGGAGLYAVGSVETTAYAASVYHTVQVQIAGCILSLRAFDVDGAAFDQIALAKDCPDKLYLPIILKQ